LIVINVKTAMRKRSDGAPSEERKALAESIPANDPSRAPSEPSVKRTGRPPVTAARDAPWAQIRVVPRNVYFAPDGLSGAFFLFVRTFG